MYISNKYIHCISTVIQSYIYLYRPIQITDLLFWGSYKFVIFQSYNYIYLLYTAIWYIRTTCLYMNEANVNNTVPSWLSKHIHVQVQSNIIPYKVNIVWWYTHPHPHTHTPTHTHTHTHPSLFSQSWAGLWKCESIHPPLLILGASEPQEYICWSVWLRSSWTRPTTPNNAGLGSMAGELEGMIIHEMLWVTSWYSYKTNGLMLGRQMNSIIYSISVSILSLTSEWLIVELLVVVSLVSLQTLSQ